MTDISVIIPSRDPDPDQLAAQLGALGAQRTECSYEVIVVDNGSSPPLDGIVPDQVGPAPVRVVRAALGPGINVARCAGIRAAVADLLVFCDSDDIVGPTWLDAAHRELSTGDLVVGGPLRPFFDEIGDVESAHPDLALAVVGGRPFASGCNVGFTRGVLERTGGFDESWPPDSSAEDLDLSWRCADAGVEVRFVEEMGVDYRLRRDLRGLIRQRAFYARGDVRICDRHGWPPGRRAFARRVAGQCKGLLWDLPRSVGRSSGRWRLARRLGTILGGVEGLLRPVARSPVRGVGLDLRDPTTTVVVGPVDDLPSAMAASERLVGERPELEIVVITSRTMPTTGSGPIRAIDGSRLSDAAVRRHAQQTTDRDLLLFSRGVPDAARVDQHVAALTTWEVTGGSGLRWVRTRRLGRHPLLSLDELGIRASALVELGGFAEELHPDLVAQDLGLRAVAAGLRIADLDGAPLGGGVRSPRRAFALGRRSAALRRRHRELPTGAVTGIVMASCGGRPARAAGLIGALTGRLVRCRPSDHARAGRDGAPAPLEPPRRALR